MFNQIVQFFYEISRAGKNLPINSRESISDTFPVENLKIL
jgi:hypothetical protein